MPLFVTICSFKNLRFKIKSRAFQPPFLTKNQVNLKFYLQKHYFCRQKHYFCTQNQCFCNQKSVPYSQIITPISQHKIYPIFQPSDHQYFTKFERFPNLKPTFHSPPNSSFSRLPKNSLCQEKSLFSISLFGEIKIII